MQGCTALQRLHCQTNQLAALNVQGFTALRELYCRNNRLTALNVQGLTALVELSCSGNGLTTLEVQGCVSLQWLWCYSNRLNAEVFIKIFNDLFTHGKAACWLYTEETGVTEGNHTDFTAPPDLADAFDKAKTVKNWGMCKYDAAGHDVGI